MLLRLRFVTIVCALIATAACSAPSTPAGALGAPVDLRASLPADVRARAPADAQARAHTGTIKVGESGASVEVRWRSFVDGTSAFLTSLDVAVTQPADGVVLEHWPLAGPVNVGTEAAVVQAQRWQIVWSARRVGRTSGGTVTFVVRADGALEPPQP